MTDLHGALGRSIQALMGDRTHRELAERAGVSGAYLSSVLRGNIPSRPVVIALARACDLGREGASHLLRLAGYSPLQEHEWSSRKPSSADADPAFGMPEPDAGSSAWLALDGPRGELTPERGALPPLVLEGGGVLDEPGAYRSPIPQLRRLADEQLPGEPG